METIADEDKIPNPKLTAEHNDNPLTHKLTAEAEINLTEIDEITGPIACKSMKRVNLEQLRAQEIANIQDSQNLDPCGPFCIWLNADQQREIIRNLLTTNEGMTTLKSSSGVPGEKRFLVSSGWWRKWCDFVNFDQIESEQPSTQQKHLQRERKKSRSTSRHHSAKKRNCNISMDSSNNFKN